jgi:hypothetical protein
MTPVAAVPASCTRSTRSAILILRKVFPALTIILLPWASALSQRANSTISQQTSTEESQSTAEPALERPANNYLAVIIQSGSTNTRPYRVVIRKDGSATSEVSGTTRSALHIGSGNSEPARLQEFPRGTIDVKTLHRLLKQIRDVSKIPTQSCPKSVSFGTRTEIEYGNKRSGDLQCIRQVESDGDQKLEQASEDLSKFVQTTLSKLNINDRRME